MRSVQIVDQSSDQTTRADHVIGIDESGQVIGPESFALAAVRCPREDGELLAELLVQNELAPWLGKSQTLAENVSQEERDRRVEDFIDSLAQESIQWKVAVGYSQGTIHHKAAAVCILAKKTITPISDFQGDSVLLPDGATSMYGDSQEHLRTQAAQIFDGSFQSAFGGVYVTGLPKGDLTYPEVTAADYLAGYIRKEIEEGRAVEELPDEVIRFSHDWREPTVSPLPFYEIIGANGEYGEIAQTRVAAWIKGRHPDGRDHDISSQWENTVQMLESELVQEYLLNTIAP